MRARRLRIVGVLAAGAFALASMRLAARADEIQKKPKKQKAPEVRVGNYFGGIFIIGDGGVPDGPCFRINGRVTAGDFFNDLKSFDSDDGVTFRRGKNEVTDFPNKLVLAFSIHDQPCAYGLQPVLAGTYLTQETMSSLKVSLYWKSGVELRPADIDLMHFSVAPIQPYAKDLTNELPKRYLWSYELGVPSEGVPLTDSLVLIFRNPEGRIVARVAARL
jgi:hypothetical protein